LKGLLHCGVCGRRLSIQHSKGRYTYFFCLGQKNDPAGTCRERYVAADDLEAQVEYLYARIELPAAWAERLREEMATEIVERQRADAAQRELLTRRLAKAEAQRRKLLDAYYAGAIDVTTLKSEQARIGADIQVAKDRMGDLDANLGEWQEILELAATFATRCGDAYAEASDRTRKQFNAAVFERLDVKDGRLCHEEYRPPFNDIFSVSEFEYGTRVVPAGIEPVVVVTMWLSGLVQLTGMVWPSSVGVGWPEGVGAPEHPPEGLHVETASGDGDHRAEPTPSNTRLGRICGPLDGQHVDRVTASDPVQVVEGMGVGRAVTGDGGTAPLAGKGGGGVIERAGGVAVPAGTLPAHVGEGHTAQNGRAPVSMPRAGRTEPLAVPDLPPGDTHVLALDLGTGGPKAAVLSAVGTVKADGFAPVPLQLLPGGGAEQSPDDWWSAVVIASRQAIDRSGVAVERIVGVGCTAQWLGTVPVDGDGRPLGDAVIWMDSRGAPLVRRIVRGRVNVLGYDPVKVGSWIRRTGGAPSLSGKDPVGHILFLRAHRPDVYRAGEPVPDGLVARLRQRLQHRWRRGRGGRRRGHGLTLERDRHLSPGHQPCRHSYCCRCCPRRCAPGSTEVAWVLGRVSRRAHTGAVGRSPRHRRPDRSLDDRERGAELSLFEPCRHALPAQAAARGSASGLSKPGGRNWDRATAGLGRFKPCSDCHLGLGDGLVGSVTRSGAVRQVGDVGHPGVVLGAPEHGDRVGGCVHWSSSILRSYRRTSATSWRSW